LKTCPTINEVLDRLKTCPTINEVLDRLKTCPTQALCDYNSPSSNRTDGERDARA
jgi:hypothetical protein